MALIVQGTRTPANGASATSTAVTLSLRWYASPGAYIYDVRCYVRINGGVWTQTQAATKAVTDYTMTRAITVQPGDVVQWYQVAYWVNIGGGYEVDTAATWSLTGAPDTTAPTITNTLPAAGNVAPGTAGVTFSCTVPDNIAVTQARLYIDDALVYTWTNPSGAISRTEPLTLGPHTYRFWCRDAAGNSAAPSNASITVINSLPQVPTGTITVAGQTGAVQVANLGNVAVSWPAFLDGNPEDPLRYSLANRIAGGTWTTIATGLLAPSYEWTPDLGLGSAELRVWANDGSGDSAYLARTGITILSSQSPTMPVLTAPAGGESWREGETRTLTWTPATHPEGLPITIQAQFSALGDFTDAVEVGSEIPNTGSLDWTLPTNLV